MTPIRPFTDFDDALQAVTEAGFNQTSHRMANTSFSPQVFFRHPNGEEIEVLWHREQGQINRRKPPAEGQP
ncbi:MAG: hypothetical protein EOM21_13090 [Gammaproteobacteria bacterium]|nr:hypothetical protein [Gammaproteobacteria bacterium]